MERSQFLSQLARRVKKALSGKLSCSSNGNSFYIVFHTTRSSDTLREIRISDHKARFATNADYSFVYANVVDIEEELDRILEIIGKHSKLI